MTQNPKRSKQTVVFVALCVVCVAGLGWFYWRAANRGPSPMAAAKKTTAMTTQAAAEPSPPLLPVASLPRPASQQRSSPTSKPALSAVPEEASVAPPRRVFFRWTGTDQHYGQLAFIDYPKLEPRFVEKLACEVVHYAADNGICLKAQRGVFTRYTAELFNAGFERMATIPLAGIPSRTRMSRDGRMAAVTVFLTGHSYSSVDFTTQTLLINVASGQVLAELEQFAVTREGKPFEAKDFNFWGVTFTPDGERFYCTVSSNRRHYLLEGEIGLRKARVIHENVECPSVSPDARRVAYKSRIPGDRVVWQLQVLDLATGAETPLAEKRSVDDQLEWLDRDHVLYSLPQSQIASSATTNVWIVAADGTTSPRLFLENAYSPAVVR